jgi:UDP-N-acetylmuramyl pentapeptide phosphotransferase/UDP-N-acetylglucosamine-1-phosphate transferase/glycosyltransferase involved in cell wall biosynthesis
MLYLISFIASATAAAAITPALARCAKWMGIVDLPNARKIHREPTPRIGGLAIFFAISLVCAPALIFLSRGHTFGGFAAQLVSIWVAGGFLLGVGLLDDIFSISSKLKLLTIVAAAAAFCAVGGAMRAIQINGLSAIPIGTFSWPASILWIVGVTVSINFIDGLDGLAAGISSIACGVIAIVAALHGESALAAVALALFGSLSGFLIHNWHPAKVFMGDCGSMFAGFVIACLSLLVSSRVGTIPGLVLPAMALSIAIVDAMLTFIRRGVLHRRSVFSAERGHIHHHLLDNGLCHVHAALLLNGLSLVAASIGFAALLTRGWAKVGVWFLIVPFLGVVFQMAGSVRARDTVNAIRRNRSLSRAARDARSAFEEVQLRFRLVSSFDKWWDELCIAAENIGLYRLSMSIVNRDGSQRELQWTRAAIDGPDEFSPNESDFGDSLLQITIPVADRRTGEAPSLKVELVSGFSLEAAGQRLAMFTRVLAENNLQAMHLKNGGSYRSPAMMAPADRKGAASPLRLFPPTVKVAVIHDFLYTYAGAEKVLEQILLLCPEADLFSLFDFLPADQRQFILNKRVKTSFLQKMPFASRLHRLYLPLMPIAVEQFDLSAYDVVISSSYLAAKGVLTRPGQLHACYCHSPVRFAWDLQNQYLGQGRKPHQILKSLFARLVLHYIRGWDVRSSNGVDAFATNSDFVASRIQKVYRRPSKTIYPPVDIERFAVREPRKSFYVTASRLVSYKKVDLIVEAFTRTPNRELVVIGEGPDLAKLTAMAGPNVRVLGYQPFERLKYYMQHARAFVFAAEEDFGITPVEAQACGTPVIAYGRGGVLESVINQKTGVFFAEQTPESLLNAVEEFERLTWSAAEIRANAERFSARAFREHFTQFMREEYSASSGVRALSSTLRTGVKSLESAGVGLLPIVGMDDFGADTKIESASGPHTPSVTATAV